MSYQLRIIAQYSENYAAFDNNWDGKTTHWKHKHGCEFIVNDFSSELRLVLSLSDVREMVEKILAEKSNNVTNYTFLDMEFISDKPIDITTAFMEISKKKVAEIFGD